MNTPGNDNPSKNNATTQINISSLNIRQLHALEPSLIDDIVNIYQEAFGGAPYFEVYDRDLVKDIINSHLPFYVAVTQSQNNAVGIACAHPVLCGLNASTRDYLLKQSKQDIAIDLKDAIYLSELAVSSRARGAGIGTQLTIASLGWGIKNGYQFCLTRTAETGSNSLRIFLTLGFQPLPFVQDTAQESIKSASLRRIWLFKKI